jgi:hypothetical protein
MKIRKNSMIKTGLLTIGLAALWCISCSQHLFAADFWVDNANVCVGSAIDAHYDISYDELLYLGWIEGNPTADFYNGNTCVASIGMTDDGYYGFYADYSYASPSSPSDDVSATLGAQVDEDSTGESWDQQGVTWHIKQKACVPGTPPDSPVTENPSGVSGTYIDLYWWGYIKHNATGTLNNITYSVSWDKGDQDIPGCGLLLGVSRPLAGWTYDFGVDVEVAPHISIGMTGHYDEGQKNFVLYNEKASPYKEWYGQEWTREVTPVSSSFTGTDAKTVVAGDPPYSTETINCNGDSAPFVGSKSFKDYMVGTDCSVKCCPTTATGS